MHGATTQAETTVMVNVVTAYQKAHFRLGTERISIDWPVAVLGVLPVRRARLDLPISDLQSIGLVVVAFRTRLLVAFGLIVLTLITNTPLAVTATLGVAAVLFLLLSVVAAVEVTTADGRWTVPVCWLQRGRVRAFLKETQAAMEQTR